MFPYATPTDRMYSLPVCLSARHTGAGQFAKGKNMPWSYNSTVFVGGVPDDAPLQKAIRSFRKKYKTKGRSMQIKSGRWVRKENITWHSP